MTQESLLTIDLISVLYSGKNIGKEWEFTLTLTPPGVTVNIPKHTLEHNTTKSYNTTLVKDAVLPGDAETQVLLIITAREHDWLVDDVANHRVVTPLYERSDAPVTNTFLTEFMITERPIVIPRIGKLEFKFGIALRCVVQ